MEEKDFPALMPQYNGQMIYQSNPLIESCKQMDIMTGRLFYTALMEITPQLTPDNVKHDFQEIVVPAETIVRLFGGNKAYYSKLEEIADRLMEQKVIIKDPDKETYDATNMFERMHFSAREGGLHILFTNSMKPHLLTLADKQYTRIAAKTIFAMKSMYAIRLLELILQYQNINDFKKAHCIQRYMTVDEIRFYLNVPDTKTYKRMSDFRRQVLDKPISDINEKTEYIVSYDVRKKGREVEGFNFSLILPENDEGDISVEKLININETARLADVNEDATVDNLQADIRDVMRRYGVGKIVAARLAKEFDDMSIRNNIRYSLEQRRVKNLGAYIVKAVREDYYGSKKAAEENLAAERKAAAERAAAEQARIIEAAMPQVEEVNEIGSFMVKMIKMHRDKGQKIPAKYMKILDQVGLTVEDVLAGKRRKE